MTEPEIPVAVYLLLLCEFLVGTIVGASVAKDRTSALVGMAIAMFLAFAVIVYWLVLGTMTIVPPSKLLATVLITLLFFFFLWGICLLAACAGYWSAFIVSGHFGIGRNRITLASLFAFITVLAVVTALTTMK